MTARQYSRAEVTTAARLQLLIDAKLAKTSSPAVRAMARDVAQPHRRSGSPELVTAARRLQRQISAKAPAPPRIPSLPVSTWRPSVIVTGLALALLLVGGASPVAAVAAILPVGVAILAVLVLDRRQPYAERRFWRYFGRGAMAAMAVMLVFDTSERPAAEGTLGSLLGEPALAESLKGLLLILALVRTNTGLVRTLDGIVYSGFIGLGFAFVQNVVTVGYVHGAPEQLAVLVLTPVAQPLFTCLLGMGLILAIQARGLFVRVVAVLVGYLGAIALHSLSIATHFLVAVPTLILVALLATAQYDREIRSLTGEIRSLADDKIIGPSEPSLLTSLRARRTWRRMARAHSGAAVARAVSQYQAAVTELAFLRRGARTGHVAPSADIRIVELTETARRARARATRTTN
ncbi:PrsW family glutamic-type intramembrane protease [Amycolatopsis japonica]|uniref:PrsW family glutamic-type intramembrane protease n=1 Tax=Amycolatopsis japonica TaxID=208439 RepID=UPI0033EC49F2